MSAKAKIAKLESLLTRVQTRAAEPRAVAHAAPAVAEPEIEQEERTQLDAVQTADVRTSPPPPEPMVESYDEDQDADVEVSAEVVEVDIDVDEPIAAESGAQPVAYATEPPAELEEVIDDDVPVNTRPSGASEELAASPAANELEEPTPSSSRRPIADEALPGAEAYEAESSPRHTPPPESGKQVAVSPSAHPPRKSTVPPPPSLEGHTLIGGWREPGLANPPPGATPGMGVRVPAPPPQAPPAPPAMAPPAVGSSPRVAEPQPSGTRLSPDITRPDLPPAAKVASIEGASPIAKPETMGDLLDLTLGI
ncbi:MAG: hypothetical protein JST00_17450 [Deltaproteobacteria bacterium]|nr:hypothetical protein [Deltaproteobacteria bacterium]